MQWQVLQGMYYGTGDGAGRREDKVSDEEEPLIGES
jgi:hypothetical protein